MKTITKDSSFWKWKEWQNLPYLTCDLLDSWKHGFFTRQFYPQTPETIIKVLAPKARPYRVKQVHGNRILLCEEISNYNNSSFPEADGIISDGLDRGVWVASADCNPVLIGDISSDRVAAIHAGWRGTAGSIVQKAIALFQKNGSNLKNLRIGIGPAISGSVYQVTEEVAAEVGKTIIDSKIAETIPEIIKALWELPNTPLVEDSELGKVKLDVRLVNAIQLEQLGISQSQYTIAPYCTYQEKDYFFSYRRSNRKQIQWSGIISNNK